MSLKEGTGSEICLRRSRSSTAAVMSTVSEIEKSGAVAFDSAMRRDTVCWSRVSSWISASPLAPASPRLASLAGSFFFSLCFLGLSFFGFFSAAPSASSAGSALAPPPFSAAACTSALTIRPPGPVPSS